MRTIDLLGILDMKKVNLHQKCHDFAPDQLHYLICPKPPDEMIAKTKSHCRRTIAKRLDEIKMTKNKKAISDNEDNEDLDNKKKKQHIVRAKDSSAINALGKNKNSVVENLLA